MSAALAMSLDDIIKNNKNSGSRHLRVRRRGHGPARRFSNRAANRAASYSTAPDTTWQHDLYGDQLTAAYPAQDGRTSAIETGTMLYVSNLDYGVSNDDIKELFSEVGDLKQYLIHYDKSGRSKGTAEVVYCQRADALAAVKRYNNVQLDGKPMKLEVVGTNIGSSNGFPRIGHGRGRALERPRGGGSRGHGIQRGRGRGRGREERMSAEDLDADLEQYHSEPMELN